MVENKITDDIQSDDDNLADNIKIEQPQNKNLQEALIGIEKDRREWLNKNAANLITAFSVFRQPENSYSLSF